MNTESILTNTAKAQGSYNNESNYTTTTICPWCTNLLINCCCEDPSINIIECYCNACRVFYDCDFGCLYCTDGNSTGEAGWDDPDGDDPFDGGSSGGGGSSTGGSSGGGSGGSTSISGQSIANKSLQYTGQFTRGVVRPVTLQTTKFDCSGWVYFVLLNLDPTKANALGSSTTSIKNYIYANGGFRTTNPKVGDLAVWNTHVEIVVAVSGNAIEISGSNGADGTSVPKHYGVGGWLTISTMNQINTSGFLGFATINY
jgi:hypothetical protein